jgi:hypothetical protein
MGAVISGGGQHVGLRRIRPTATLTTVIGGAHEDATGYGGSWSLTGWAVCAYPPRGLEVVSASTDAETAGVLVMATGEALADIIPRSARGSFLA